MSGPLRFKENDAAKLAQAMRMLTTMTRETGCQLGVTGAVELNLPAGCDGSFKIYWLNDDDGYVVDDRVGD